MCEHIPLTTDEILSTAYSSFLEVKNIGFIYCDDKEIQTLFVGEKSNGKKVFMSTQVDEDGKYTGKPVEIFPDEYDEIVWENTTSGVADIYAKNEKGWFLYKYIRECKDLRESNKLLHNRILRKKDIGPFPNLEVFEQYFEAQAEQAKDFYNIEDEMTEDEWEAYAQGFENY